MLDHLCCLVHLIIGSFPVEDPHLKQRQEGRIIDLHLIHLLKPLRPSDHIGPKLIVKEQVWIHIPPPLIVGSLCVLSSFHNSVEGVLGDLDNLSQCFYKQKQREKLPQRLKGSVHNLTTGYALYCPNAGSDQAANPWLTG